MPGVDHYVNAFGDFAPTVSKSDPDWMKQLRERGMDAFRDRGFPGLRDEEWRFTRVKPIQERDFTLVTGYQPNGLTSEKIIEETFDDSGCHRLAVVDGHYAEDLSRVGKLPAGVRVVSLARAIRETPDRVAPHLGTQVKVEEHPFAALNTAFAVDGVFMEVDDGVAVEDPVHIVFASTGNETVSHPRVLIVAGKNADLTVVESYIGTGEEYFTNAVSETVCGENASVNHCKLQQESGSAFHVALSEASLARDSRYSTENISVGGGLVRNDIGSYLDGEGIDCRIDGLYLARERQHVDNHTFIRHAKPHCHSFELYKGILNDRARGVFNGKIYVDQDAQKTDAKQQNNCILLSDDARINTNPQLEIFADDVKCTHGATVGQLDKDSIFYMRSRGIEKVRAHHILIYAFAAEVVERVKVDALREQLEVELFWWLSKTIAQQEPA